MAGIRWTIAQRDILAWFPAQIFKWHALRFRGAWREGRKTVRGANSDGPTKQSSVEPANSDTYDGIGEPSQP